MRFQFARVGLAVAGVVVFVLGTAWQVVIAFALALVETTRPAESAGPALGISAVGPWILIVSGLVPSRPRRALMASLAAATAWPIAYAVNAARGMVAVQSDVWLLWPLLNYAIAGIAYFVAQSATTWAATAWSRASGKVGWARSGRPVTSCWRAPPR